MKTIIYARQSIDKKDSISIETQIELCKKELSPDEAFEVYTDKGFSGKNTNRPGFKQMMSDVEEGTAGRIIIYRLDRMSRSISDFAAIMNVLEKHEVSFTSVNEKFDTTTPMGRAMLYIIMVFAQLERETIAERITDNYYQRGKKGVWPGGPAPFGFKNEKIVLGGKLVSTIKPTKEIEIVKYIFDEYLGTNKALGSIAAELTNTYGSTYGIWNNIKLSRILHNPIYVKADADIYNYYKQKGCIMENSIEEYTGAHGLTLYGRRDRHKNKYNNIDMHRLVISLSEGVIPSDVFLGCQYKLDKNKQIKNTGKGKHSWLTGLIKCMHCGYSMRFVIYKDRRYLSCTAPGVCPVKRTDKQTIYVDEVENTADALISDYLKSINRDDIANRSGSDEITANRLKIELYKLDEQIDALVSKLMDLEGSATDYVGRRINELDKNKQDILSKLRDLAADKPNIRIPTPEEWENADKEEKHDLAQLIIEKVLVSHDDINIIWKF